MPRNYGHRARRQPRDPNAPPPASRKIADTHCQLCGRPIFANTGVIAHHGYERPWEGVQTASCRGARHLPYEQSCDLIPPEIKMTQEYVDRQQAWLDEFVANPPATLRRENTRIVGGERETIWIDEPKPAEFAVDGTNYASLYSHYSYEFRARRSETEAQLRMARSYVAYLTERLARWTPPGETQPAEVQQPFDPNPPPPARPDYRGNAGFVEQMTCRAACGGTIVWYDRDKGFECDADYRWVVMHEPSSIHIAVKTKRQAQQALYDACLHPDEVFGQPIADFYQTESPV